MLRYSLDCAAVSSHEGSGEGAEVDGVPEQGAQPVEFPSTTVAGEVLRAEELWVDDTDGIIPARCV